MKEYIFPDTNDYESTITFEDFLSLVALWYKSQEKELEYEVKKLETLVFDLKFDSILVTCRENKVIDHITFIGKDLKNNRPFTNNISPYYNPITHENGSSVLNGKDIGIFTYELQELIESHHEFDFTQRFMIKNANFQVDIDPPVFEVIKTQPKMLPIKVKSKEKIDTYYYNIDNGKLFTKSKNKYFELPINMQVSILSILPEIKMKDLPWLIGSFLIENGSAATLKKDGTILDKPLGLINLIKGNKGIIVVRVDDEEIIEKKEEQPSFQELLEKNGIYSIDTTNNSESIIESIKTILTRLKESNADLNTTPKVTITDRIFFREVTPKKKEINPFFLDSGIIKFCDLSKINFDNADIKGAHLAYSGAKIVLSKVYEKSIEGANLEGISLSGQSLDGINADNANLKNTGVFVSVDRTSIINTKFSDSTVFMLGTHVLTDEEVKAMGILVSEEKEAEANLTL